MTDDPKQDTDALHERLKAWPKIELHRHLEGSLRLETLAEIASDHNLDLPHDVEGLRPLVQVVESDPPDLRPFLDKFGVLRRFYRSPDIIARLTREAIADCAADNIKYLELRFTPRALSATRDYPLEDVTDWVIAAAREAAEEFGVKVRLIVSMNRHESVKLGEQVAQIAVDRMRQGVAGLDLAGNEASFPATPFKSVFREAKEAGLKITVHAGEWAGPESVREAIEVLGAERLGHGVKAVQDADVVEMVRERRIAFEICVTSNVQTGSVKTLDGHPLRKLYDQSLLTTINTDDPAVSDITLSGEMAVAMHHLGFTFYDLKTHTRNAARVAFLPDGERERLLTQFNDHLNAKSDT
jgi:adenosine deaminase